MYAAKQSSDLRSIELGFFSVTASYLTTPVCPSLDIQSKVLRHSSVAMLHTLIVLHKYQQLVNLVLQLLQLLPVQAARHDPVVLPVQGQTSHCIIVPRQEGSTVAGVQVPDSDCLVS